MTQVAMFSFLYAMLMSDDEEYKDTDTTTRDLRYFIPGLTDYGIWLPVRADPFTLFSKMFVEHYVNLTKTEQTEDWTKFKKAFKDFATSAFLGPTPMPQLAKTVLEANMNYNLNTDRAIVGQGLAGRATERQFTSTTSLLARDMSKATGDTVSTATSATAISTTSTSSVNYNSKVSAWGLNIAGKLITQGKSNLYSQITFGNGLGYLVEDATNYSAYLQLPTSSQTTDSSKTRFTTRFNTAAVTNGIIGYAHWWTDEFRTNIGGSYTKIKNSSSMPVMSGSTQANARIKKALVNAIYSPVKNIDIGLELMYAVRETVSGTDTANGTTYATYSGGTGNATQMADCFSGCVSLKNIPFFCFILICFNFIIQILKFIPVKKIIIIFFSDKIDKCFATFD
jgi:hypothetical protein